MRGRRRWRRAVARLGLLALACAACEEPRPVPGAARMRLELGATEVDLGRAFPLAVVRSWSRGAEPAAWRDELLAPLVVRPLSVRLRERSGGVEETRRFLAYAFVTGEIELAAVEEGVALSVRSALPEGEPGPPELPGEPLPPPWPWPRWLGGAAAAVLLAAWALRRRGRGAARPSPARAPAAVASDPAARARARLAALRTRAPAGEFEHRADAQELAGLLRDYLAERFALPAPRRTTEELAGDAAAVAALATARHAVLCGCLTHCDRVKFARVTPAPAERECQLAAAEGFLEGQV